MSTNDYAIHIFAGGNLYQGDIEDIGGESHIKCPRHGFNFNLQTGVGKGQLKVSQPGKRSCQGQSDTS